ncbi:MAG: hypothetical protein Q9228_007772, partial [Teloschistes exilis]
IFLISALNHHISILSILVPDAYLEYITDGPSIPPSDAFNPTNKNRYKLKARRSRWYDLLVPGERAEVMRGIWGACSWGMRDLGTDT